jgi:hypothetical protein
MSESLPDAGCGKKRPKGPRRKGDGWTVSDLARRYRVSVERVRGWIRRGELRAIDRRDRRCSRPAWVIMPEALADFERGRSATISTPPKVPRRRKQAGMIDFFPD